MNSTSVNFYNKLKDKKSSNILSELYLFINTSFPTLMKEVNEISEVSSVFQDLISKFVNDFSKTWNIEFPNNRLAYVEICEGFENLITKTVYPQIIPLLEEDDRLEKLYKKFSFVTLKHLDLEINLDEFDFVIQLKSKINNIKIDLSEITQFRSPKEKLNVLVNFCNYICSKYKITDKIPLVKFTVYALLKSNIHKLKGNLRFIALFRHKTIINSEEDYYLSIFFQAIEFIEKLESSKLKIDKNEFINQLDAFNKKELLNSKSSLEGNIIFM